MELRWCEQCGQNKARSSRHKICPQCRNRELNEWRRANPEEARAKDRRGNLRRYGLTPEQWEALFDSQGRACGICKRATPNGHGWHTDHCHSTNKVRGILCHDCNIAVGAYERVILPNFTALTN